MYVGGQTAYKKQVEMILGDDVRTKSSGRFVSLSAGRIVKISDFSISSGVRFRKRLPCTIAALLIKTVGIPS